MKVYTITRQDLKPGAQLAQSVHVMHQFTKEHTETCEKWQQAGGNLVCLSVPNEKALEDLLTTLLWEKDCPYSFFREPDFDNQLTALALGPEARKWVSSLPLALRDAVSQVAA